MSTNQLIENVQRQYRSHVSSNGRLNIPAQLRKAANLKDGDEVLLILKDNIIHVQPLEQVIAEAQALVAQFFSTDDLMKDLKAMRITDTTREAQKLDNRE
jgi:AbrB family looped-hinge helix DNA binding protein